MTNWVQYHFDKIQRNIDDAVTELSALQMRYASATDSDLTPRERGARVNALAAKMRALNDVKSNWNAHPWAGDKLPE